MLNSSVLVLNRSYLPIHVTTARRAFSLIYQGSALAVNGNYETFDFDAWRRQPWEQVVAHESVGTPSGAIRLPRVIVLIAFDRVPKRHVRYSRLNIFARDKFTCQYCGDRPHRSKLNLDHVIPRALGGRTTWENVVCSCVECNRRKGGRTPAQARLRLLRRPARPRWTPVIHPASRARYDEWRPFLHIVDDRNEGYLRAAGAD
jgi:5-methylcytosine-specific restriction endonuclease McrA